MKQFAWKFAGKAGAWIALALILTVAATPAAAQKNKSKDKKKDAPSADAPADQAFPTTSDSQAIDRAIGEALGYWQIGDTDSLHKYYADDVVVVSGAWEPPVIGWDNYVKAYQAQRAQVTGARMERTNTYIKVNGNSAWATFQFIYAAMVDGKVAQFHGHTTLILNKQGNAWVVAVNHSSIVDSTIGTPAPPGAPAHPSSP